MSSKTDLYLRQLDFWRLVLGHYCADVGAYGDRGIHHCHLAFAGKDAKHERYFRFGGVACRMNALLGEDLPAIVRCRWREFPVINPLAG